MPDTQSFTEQDFFGQALQDALEVLQKHSDDDLNNLPGDENRLMHFHHCLQSNASYLTESSTYSWRNAINTEADLYPVGAVYQTLQTIEGNPEMCIATPQQKGKKGRKKVRLFEYLHESLHNPNMANCIQWIDKPNGIFQFVSKNKEKLAEQWGERKGNRKIMTYQKMARALRNYGRTGEITKIRRKLTYQFGAVVLQRLSLPYLLRKNEDVSPLVHEDQEYQCADDWLTYHYYTCNTGYELQPACSTTTPFYYAS